jgi:hypothetical protein
MYRVLKWFYLTVLSPRLVKIIRSVSPRKHTVSPVTNLSNDSSNFYSVLRTELNL